MAKLSTAEIIKLYELVVEDGADDLIEAAVFHSHIGSSV